MKNLLKKLLCLTLALLMALFCLAGCGDEITGEGEDEETEAQAPEAPDGAGKGNGEGNGEGNGSTVLGENVAIGFEIKDVEALLAMFGIEDVDIHDLKLDYTASQAGGFVSSISAKLFDEDHNLKIFSGENLAVSSTLLDRAYGTDDPSAFFKKIIQLYMTPVRQEGSSNITSNPSYETSNPSYETEEPTQSSSVLGALLSADPQKLAAFGEKYYNRLIEQFKFNSGLVNTVEGTDTVLYGELKAEYIALVCVNVFEEMCEDEDFYELFNIDKEEFLDGKPPKYDLLDELRGYLTEAFNELNIKITVNNIRFDSKNSIKNFDVVLECGDKTSDRDFYTLYVRIDTDAGKYELGISNKTNDDYAKISITPDKIEADVNMRILSVYGDADYSYYYESTTIIKGTLNASESGIVLDLDITGTSEYPNWQEVRLSTTSIDFTLNDKKLDFVYDESTDWIYGTIENPDELDTYFNKIEIKADFSETEINALIKSSYGETYSEYPEDNYTETTEATAKLTMSDNSIKLEVNMDGVSYVISTVETEDEYIFSFSVNGEEVTNMKWTKTAEGTKTTHTLKSFTANKITTDLSEIGISFYIDTDAEMETLSGYTSIDDMTAEELSEILEGIETRNKALFEKIEAAFEYRIDEETETRPLPIPPGVS